MGNHGAVRSPRRGIPQYDPRNWLWSSTQLEPGELRVEHVALDLGSTFVATATINCASLHRVRAPANSFSLLTRSRIGGAVFVGGRELTSGCGLRMDAGTEVELVAHQASACVLISVDKTLIMPEVGYNWTSVGPGAGVKLVGFSIEAGTALEERVRAILQGTLSQHDSAEFVHQLMTALLSGAAAWTPDRMTLTATRLERRRRRAVEAARAYIREHLPEPMRLADLCRNTHLRARSLEYGFREVVRLSPMRYLRMLRLGEVRRELLKSAGSQRSISEIALDAGFSHLSQFTVDYKKVFGETPSATRRRLLAQPAA